MTWSGRSVFLTGHTGFKGGWLALWLWQLGARVHGYALDPPTEPSFFGVARLGEVMASDSRADIADAGLLQSALERAAPDIVFHLAAQSLVREGYRNPARTFATNVQGTVNLLEAVRSMPGIRAVVVVTTDKVYENREWVHPYRELDPLGGHDPYSASKAAAEIVTASYRSSFFGAGPWVATARAGNVIGGGDWSDARLVPDCLHAFSKGEPVRLRFPNSIRPWQHVLEPLHGYLQLGERLLGSNPQSFATAWNFGPDGRDDASVAEVARALVELWGPGACLEIDLDGDHPHEAGVLRLDNSRALALLNWRPRWALRQALEATIDWYQAFLAGANVRERSLGQLKAYLEAS